jgi:hypothetical protein
LKLKRARGKKFGFKALAGAMFFLACICKVDLLRVRLPKILKVFLNGWLIWMLNKE